MLCEISPAENLKTKLCGLGFTEEGSRIKSKVDELKAAYDREESPNLEEYEPNTVASLLKQYLRELPENLLTKELMPRFEDACGKSTEAEKVQECQRLLKELPECNHLLISWLIVHMDHCQHKKGFFIGVLLHV
uniref:Rho-GAP domain-containing protein n=1 Tax=Coturnix japonica TaxID=93934 RepID=A0A8C2T4U7_COTJA